MARQEQPTLIASVQRALRLLDAVGSSDRPMTAKALSRATGTPPATTYHLLRTLLHEGYLERLDGAYVLGRQVTALSKHGTAQAASGQIRSVLTKLRDTTRAASYLVLFDDGELRLSEVVDGPAAPRVDLWVGFDEAAHATALGKCVLANLADSVRADYLSRHPLADLTRRTITDRNQLLRSIGGRQSVVVDREEYAIGTACAAVPVLAGARVGAIAVSVPVRRLPEIIEKPSTLGTAASQASLMLAAV